MDRLACISLPSLALQVALRRFPVGHQAPVVLVKEDRPTSLVLHLNRAARDQGLRPGMRYSQALTIVRDLKGVTVTPEDLESVRQEILSILVHWSPSVEVCPFDPGCFWIGAAGLGSLYGTEAQWGTSIRSALAQRRWQAVVVVGLTRGGTYVLAVSRRRSTVVRSAQAEQRAFDQAPLSLFPLTVRHRRLLERLGLTTLAGVLKIPADELARRLGPDLGKELRSLAGWDTLPLQSVLVSDPLVRIRRLETPVADRQMVLSLVDEPLGEGLKVLAARARLLAELRVVFVLESQETVLEVLRPAEPTTDCSFVLKLLHLRLAQTVFPTPVVEMRLAFDDVPQPPSTGELFSSNTARDLGKGLEALALIRARWGNGSVVRAVLADSHIPDQSYRWEAITRLSPPRPTPAQGSTAVRRIRRGDTGGNPAGQRLGAPLRLRVVSGSDPVDREYWFLLTRRREVAWVSWDLLARQSRWEGMVD